MKDKEGEGKVSEVDVEGAKDGKNREENGRKYVVKMAGTKGSNGKETTTDVAKNGGPFVTRSGRHVRRVEPGKGFEARPQLWLSTLTIAVFTLFYPFLVLYFQ